MEIGAASWHTTKLRLSPESEKLMNRRPLLFFLIVLSSAVCCVQAEAHYLWVLAGKGQGTEKFADIYFEESPAPGDGHYLKHFLGSSKVWVRTLEQPSPDAIEAAEVKEGKNRWMRVPLPSGSEYSIDSYGKFGVYAYGKTNVLLHYYARNLVVSSHDAVHELGRAEQMNLDLVPHNFGPKLDVKLLWKGKPVGDRMVFVRGPKGFRKNVKTNDSGRIELDSLAPGRYTFRSSVEEPTPGTDNGESYELIRHNITLVIQVPLGE